MITGPDGLLGSNLTRELLAQNFAVKAFILPGSSSQTLAGLPIERFHGNILNPDDVMAAMQGCDVVIHAAANTSVWPARSQKTWQVNYDGTHNILKAALHHNISRLVYVSSASAYQPGPKEAPGDEAQPYTGYKYGLDYVDSKYKAQELALQYVREKGLPVVIINPTFMFGEYDSQPSSGRMIIALYEGKVPGYTGGGKNFVYVRDVAHAIINAITMGRTGECYIAGHTNLYYRELFEIIGRVVGRKPPGLKIPGLAMKAYGYIGTTAGLLFGRPPALSHATVRVSCEKQFYSQEKAIRELNMPQTNIETAIQSAFDWFKENGYL